MGNGEWGAKPMRERERFRRLEAWQLAFELANRVHDLTVKYPPDEKFSLSQQSRRASISVVSNIAEGYGRRNLGDYLRHLSIARGSLFELDTQLELAEARGYIAEPDWYELVDRCGKCLNALMSSLEAKQVREDTVEYIAGSQ